MARVNLSIPDDLKSKMDDMGAKVNWSNIARDAFNIVVASHLSKQEPNMQTQIDRLRAERDALTQEDRVEGLNAGRECALNLEYRELRKLCRFDDDEYVRRLANNDITLSNSLAFHMEANDFESLFGQDDVSETFAELSSFKRARERSCRRFTGNSDNL